MYTLSRHFRQKDFIIECGYEHPFRPVAIVLTVVFCIPLIGLVINFGRSGMPSLGNWLLLTFLFGGCAAGMLLVTFLLKSQTTFRFTAGALRVTSKRTSPLLNLENVRAYDRRSMPAAVTWLVPLGQEYAGGFKFRRTFRFELHIACGEAGAAGYVIDCGSERQMDRLANDLDRFMEETPYDESLWSAEEERLREPIKAKLEVRERREPSPMAACKQLRLDRNETPIEHDPDPRSRFLVRIEPKDDKSPLTLSTRRGGFLSKSLANLSYGIWQLVTGLLVYGVIFAGMFGGGFCWLFVPDIEDRMKDYRGRIEPQLHAFVHDRVLPVLAGSLAEPLREAYLRDPGDGLYMFLAVGVLFVVIPAWISTLWLVNLIFQLVRWPFWERRELRFHGRPGQAGSKIVLLRSSDRLRRRTIGHTASFFRLVSAHPKTHPLLTGRSSHDRDPAWESRFLLVVVTEDGSFPLPVSGPEEQEFLIRHIQETDDETESH